MDQSGPHACLLEQIAAKCDVALPEMRRYFGAVILSRIRENYPGRPHPDDPVIECPVVCYMEDEHLESIRKALDVKSNKGRSYATDILVLHTLPENGKPHFPGLGMDADSLVALGRASLAEYTGLLERFREIWFLNDCTVDGKRLWQLN